MTATNTNPASAIRVTPSKGALGAEISGINVAQPCQRTLSLQFARH